MRSARAAPAPNRPKARGAAATELVLSLTVLLPVALYVLYLGEALTLGLRVQQAAIHQAWDVTGMQVHRYASPSEHRHENEDRQVSAVVAAVRSVARHVAQQYATLRPFEPGSPMGAVTLVAPTLDPPSGGEDPPPTRPEGRSPTENHAAFTGARASVLFTDDEGLSGFQPDLVGHSLMTGAAYELEGNGLLRRDYSVKTNASATARPLPIAQQALQWPFGQERAFRENPLTGAFELRFCGVGRARRESGGRCSMVNSFHVLVDDFAVSGGQPIANRKADNPELHGVVSQVYAEVGHHNQTEVKDAVALRLASVVSPSQFVGEELRPRFALFELGIGPSQRHARPVPACGERVDVPVYTSPYEDEQMSSAYARRTPRYLGR